MCRGCGLGGLFLNLGEVKGQGIGCRAYGVGCRAWSVGCMAQGRRVSGVGCRVLGFRQNKKTPG